MNDRYFQTRKEFLHLNRQRFIEWAKASNHRIASADLEEFHNIKSLPCTSALDVPPQTGLVSTATNLIRHLQPPVRPDPFGPHAMPLMPLPTLGEIIKQH